MPTAAGGAAKDPNPRHRALSRLLKLFNVPTRAAKLKRFTHTSSNMCAVIAKAIFTKIALI